MKKEQILEIIKGKYNVVSEEKISNGICLKLDNGAIINCFSNGNHNVQGKNIQEVKDVLAGKSGHRKLFVGVNLLFIISFAPQKGIPKGT